MPGFKNIWMKVKSGVSKAFRVEPEQAFKPTVRQEEICDKLAKWIVGRRLTLPAIMTLESVTPLNFLGSQAMVFFQPFITAFLNASDYKEFQQMLEYRQSIQWMIDKIEAFESSRKNKCDPASTSTSLGKE